MCSVGVSAFRLVNHLETKMVWESKNEVSVWGQLGALQRPFCAWQRQGATLAAMLGLNIGGLTAQECCHWTRVR